MPNSGAKRLRRKSQSLPSKCQILRNGKIFTYKITSYSFNC